MTEWVFVLLEMYAAILDMVLQGVGGDLEDSCRERERGSFTDLDNPDPITQ